jgi:chemotaxis protein methyltransferase CheR
LNLRNEDFYLFQDLIFQLAGISFDENKSSLVENRLASRIKKFQFQSYRDYFHFLKSPENNAERQYFIDVMTTNETSFFREINHFEFLQSTILPNFKSSNKFRVWSAACSSGEEAYSIAMVLENYLGSNRYEILGTDLSSRVLEKSKMGLYPMERAEKIPEPYLKKFCLKGKNSMEGFFKIDENLKMNIVFKSMNLNQKFPDLGKFDLIFVRNVMIYFNAETKEKLIRNMIDLLPKNGFLFIGQSETLLNRNLGLEMIKPSIYKKT